MFPETFVVLVILFLLLLWLLVKIRKFFRWFMEKKGLAFGTFLAVLGTLLFASVVIIGQFLPGILKETEIEFFSKVALALVGLGVLVVIIDKIYRAWKKRLLLELEEERREYIERVRYGLKIEQAEKIAKEHIKKATGKNTELVASKKEFKYWAVYLKDRDGIFYRVIIDQQGRVEEWETMKELPRYLFGI